MRVVAACLAVVLTVTAGCGDDDDDASTASADDATSAAADTDVAADTDGETAIAWPDEPVAEPIDTVMADGCAVLPEDDAAAMLAPGLDLGNVVPSQPPGTPVTVSQVGPFPVTGCTWDGTAPPVDDAAWSFSNDPAYRMFFSFDVGPTARLTDGRDRDDTGDGLAAALDGEPTIARCTLTDAFVVVSDDGQGHDLGGDVRLVHTCPWLRDDHRLAVDVHWSTQDPAATAARPVATTLEQLSRTAVAGVAAIAG